METTVRLRNLLRERSRALTIPAVLERAGVKPHRFYHAGRMGGAVGRVKLTDDEVKRIEDAIDLMSPPNAQSDGMTHNE